jgi:hypothetical protein
MGANALSSLLKSEQLSADNIDDAIEKIHDALQDQKQIEEAIDLGSEQHYDDAQLEKELAALVVDEKQHKDQDIDRELDKMEKLFSDIQTSDTFPKTKNVKTKELA